MLIRQEKSSPIVDFFHDSGVFSLFNNLSNIVDEFEVETKDVDAYCDGLISSLKGLKSIVKKLEGEEIKKKSMQKVEDSIQRGGVNWLRQLVGLEQICRR